LAVKRKVSASSQNQAFNALLFFFRHILKTEFGEIKDVPRAKRKPYIKISGTVYGMEANRKAEKEKEILEHCLSICCKKDVL
jgi:hypothetical protein